MKVIRLAGDHYAMGRQHAHQVRELRPLILQAMHERLARLEQSGADAAPLVAELVAVWEVASLSTLEMLRGIADELDLDWRPFFHYTVASYLEDRTAAPSGADGCTAWAATAPITQDGAPILAKNRDYRPDHLPLQCLAHTTPAEGYRYAYVTSAGSPAVFSSGMNEAGLAVADTHVASRDLGPGVARYSAEMELLEHHASVRSALDYLWSVPHLGDGTLVLLDAAGDMAVFETGHTRCGVVRSDAGFVVSTNHFVTPALRDRWVDRSPPDLRGNSQGRHARTTTALRASRGQVTPAWAQELMASHGGPREAICRHADMDPRSATISTVLYLPQAGRLVFGHGQPCAAEFDGWMVDGWFVGRRACA